MYLSFFLLTWRIKENNQQRNDGSNERQDNINRKQNGENIVEELHTDKQRVLLNDYTFIFLGYIYAQGVVLHKKKMLIQFFVCVT